jgi:hypothetical protein
VDGVGVLPVGGGIGVEQVPIASVAGVPGVADSNSSGSRCGESAGRNKGVLAGDDGEDLGGVNGDEENGVEVYRRGEIVASPLRNPPPSEVPTHSAALQPSWFALQVEERLWGNSQAWVIAMVLVAVRVEAPEAQAA